MRNLLKTNCNSGDSMTVLGTRLPSNMLLFSSNGHSSMFFQLSVRGKNKKEKLSGFFRNMTQSADEVLLSNQKVTVHLS